MKVQCDGCGHEEASIFCCADEAALCDACDHKVHRANKLAGKHRRFALRPASDDASPNCDVCQEKRGYIFCQEDRAILCKECDEPIHSSNELTKKHNRFLLVGARLSVQPLSSSISDSTSSEDQPDEALVTKNENMKKLQNKNNQQNAEATATATATALTAITVPVTTAVASSGSSISEYLTKECPGWHVEDLFIDDAAAAAAAATVTGNQLTPFLEADLEGNGFDLPIWVPQPSEFTSTAAGSTAFTHFQTPMMGPNKGMGPTMKSSRDCWNDDQFTVPQISPREAVLPCKRSRPSFWYY